MLDELRMRTAIRILFLVPLAAPLLATLPAAGATHAQNSKALFAKYPAGPAYKGKPAAVDLHSDKDAPNFRTRLRAAAKRRPNFAGRVIVTNWGCGASCQMIALIDARTGKVSFAGSASAGYEHRLNSRLLIVNPPETIAELYGNKPPSWLKTRYYLWKGGRLAVLKRP
jgi:hypothetical protein